ncbi:MAG: hypothetical protein GON13_01445 [Nanoarchaeota archaeon]|nr:hypothetical protein [Nanoarchaeota archaeon]
MAILGLEKLNYDEINQIQKILKNSVFVIIETNPENQGLLSYIDGTMLYQKDKFEAKIKSKLDDERGLLEAMAALLANFDLDGEITEEDFQNYMQNQNSYLENEELIKKHIDNFKKEVGFDKIKGIKNRDSSKKLIIFYRKTKIESNSKKDMNWRKIKNRLRDIEEKFLIRIDSFTFKSNPNKAKYDADDSIKLKDALLNVLIELNIPTIEEIKVLAKRYRKPIN